MTTHRKPLPLEDIEKKVREVPLIPVDMGPPRQPGRLGGPIIQLVHLEG